MAMSMWWRSIRKQGANKATVVPPAWYVCSSTTGAGDDAEKKKQLVPEGYVPMVLVDDDDDEQEEQQQGQRIMVHVRMLREPCVAALLDMAAQQFGHNQPGVIRVPCNLIRFKHMMIDINGLTGGHAKKKMTVVAPLETTDDRQTKS